MKVSKFFRLNLLLICLTLCFSLFTIGEVVAATYVTAKTYYVSPSGSDSNPGTKEKPFKTIQKGADVVVPGDTVIVGDGRYSDFHACGTGLNCVVRTETNGTSDAWITYKAENKWGAIIDGNNTTSQQFGFLISSNYTRIEDFDIKEHYWDGVFSNEDNTYVYIKGNKIHHNGNVVDLSCRTDPNCSGHSGVSQGDDTAYFTYDGNLIYSNGRAPDPDYANSNGHDHGLYIRGVNVTIINNIFYDHPVGWQISLRHAATNYLIVNNTFGTSTHYKSGDQAHIRLSDSVTQVTMENNIFYSSLTYAMACSAGMPGTLNIKNNLTSSGMTLLEPDCLSFTEVLANNIIGKNPLFTNATNHIYTLQSSSPAIDAGLSTNAPAYDFEGELRPGDKAYDIGAYEYHDGTVGNIPPNPPLLY